MSGKVGFIGLGTMGTPMAWNIHKAGYDLCVYNRSRNKTKPFSNAGVKVCQSPKEVAGISDTIIIMVTDSDALVDVVLGYHGITAGLREDTVVINMSTVAQTTTLEVADAIELEKGRFMEAPVSGTKKPAEDATLTILTAGPEKLVKQMEPLLKTMGDTLTYCGGNGRGTAMKLTINLLLGNMMQGLAETLIFARKHDLEIDEVLNIIDSGPLSAPLFKIKGGMMKQRNFEKQFPLNLLLKDLNLITEAAERNGIYLPSTATTREAVNGAKALGFGEEDMAALVKLLEKVTGKRLNQ